MLKRIIFYGLLVLLPLAAGEVASFALATMRPDLFDYRDEILAKLTPGELERFKAEVASNVLGWDNPVGVRRLPNCVGAEVTYSYDEARIRVHPARSSQDAVILVAGDSFTLGVDVGDDETYPAALERALGVGVANLGVGGYGADQALLKLELLINRFPRARIAVLSIIYDDTARMVNSFRPVLFRETGVLFGFKPFLRDRTVHGLIGGDPFRDLGTVRAAANMAFDTDFWRRPRARFPYAVSVIQLFALPSFWVPLTAHFLDVPASAVTHRIPSVRANLRAVFDRFEAFTSRHGLRGVVAFIPGAPSDQSTGAVAISAASSAQRRSLEFIDVAISDWSGFNPGPRCHPSATGYGRIAESVANAVRPILK